MADPKFPAAGPRSNLACRLRLAGSLLPLLIFALLILPARAAEMTAALEREVIALGEMARLTVTIVGGNPNDSPRFPAVPGLGFQSVGTSQEMVINGATMTRRQSFNYAIQASRLGSYRIGPFTAVIGNQTVQAAPVILRVVRPGDPAARRNDGLDDAAFLTLQLPQRPVYVGETFVAETHLYSSRVGQLRQRPSFEAEGFTMGPLHFERSEGGFRTNNQVYSRIRFLQPLTAVRAGDLKVRAANCVLDIELNRRRPFSSLFDDTLFGGADTRQFQLSTEPTTLRVLPLPRDNVPDGFSGAVGEFQLTLTASPTNVQVGDPITLRIDISGRGNLDAVQLPEQSGWKGFRAYPAVVTNITDDPLQIVGIRRFEQAITPESAALKQIPPLVFSYFSPEAGAYHTLRTEAIPLTVTAGAATPSLNLPDAPAENGSPSSVPALAGLKPHLGTLIQPASPWAAQPWFYALAGFPWAAWCVARAWRRIRDRQLADQGLQRRRQLERQVRQGLATLATLARGQDADAFFTTLFRVVQEMLGARLGIPPASVTEGILDEPTASRGLPPATVDSLHRLFQACNQARYAPVTDPADLEALRAEAETAATSLRQTC